MKVLIDIPEEVYQHMMGNDLLQSVHGNICYKAVCNGTPIPDNASNERMVGSWIKSRDSYGNNHFTCPFCEHDIATKADTLGDNYCSNCGARLQESE